MASRENVASRWERLKDKHLDRARREGWLHLDSIPKCHLGNAQDVWEAECRAAYRPIISGCKYFIKCQFDHLGRIESSHDRQKIADLLRATKTGGFRIEWGDPKSPGLLGVEGDPQKPIVVLWCEATTERAKLLNDLILEHAK
jgi:hypothetical protein